MGKGIRRVVTGHDDSGKAIVLSDAIAPNIFNPPHRPGVQVNNLWRVFESPARLAGNEDTSVGEVPLIPSPNGSVFRIVEFSPEKDWIDGVSRSDAKRSFTDFGAPGAVDADAEPPHPLMHKTETIDYAMVLEGEITMVLDDSEVALSVGDVIVQRGTNHAWSNRSDKPCLIAFVLIDGTFAE